MTPNTEGRRRLYTSFVRFSYQSGVKHSLLSLRFWPICSFQAKVIGPHMLHRPKAVEYLQPDNPPRIHQPRK